MTESKMIVCFSGDKKWYLNDKLHNENGPAIIDIFGNKFWYLNGQLHCEDGPAVDCTNGFKSWYLNGKSLTEEEFLKQTQSVTEDHTGQIYNSITNKWSWF